MAYSNRDQIDLTRPVVREYRVKRVDRYIVTEWHDYRDGSAGVRTVGEFDGVQVANEVAYAMGQAAPGSLINCMDEPGPAPLPPVERQADEMTDFELQRLSYDFAAALRCGARSIGNAALVARLDRLQIAVDA